MDLISEFIARYRKEFDFYEQACRIASQLLDSQLQSTGIRAIVTSRAKNPQRLEAKIEQRNTSKNYSSIEDIYEDIVDLAGVRVALYFPGEREKVSIIIQSLFGIVGSPKEFPIVDSSPSQVAYVKRFSGYYATHYRVNIKESCLNESQKRYSEAKLEIQVASVLMHAWSEVEHDLVYKPLQGKLSMDEYAILDELNGMVLAGEIALERLQRAAETRLSKHDSDEYTNHYDVASSLIDMSRAKLQDIALKDSTIGRVDILFALIKEVSLNTPEHLSKYVEAIHSDFERRPLTDQVIDQILAEDPNRYSVYERIKSHESAPTPATGNENVTNSGKGDAMSRFLRYWIQLESVIKSRFNLEHPNTEVNSYIKNIDLLTVNKEFIESFNRLRQFRNVLIHGLSPAPTEYINSQTELLVKLIQELEKPTARRGVRKLAVRRGSKPDRM